jgi:hypothetical protein
MEIVNGYPCKNCTDVDYAKKNIDPAHPKDGPYGVNNPEKLAQAKRDKVVKFGGALAGLNAPPARVGAPDPGARPSAGSLIDLRA